MNELNELGMLAFDASILFAIIAINMTVIGLTSLAESKNIIGVDYGKFLLRKYKIGGYVRIYYLLILFAVINVSSIFMVIVDDELFRIIHFFVLMISLMFAIYYFFSFIIVENRAVKRQIIMQEILGHYRDSDDVTTYRPDLVANVPHGTRTRKKISQPLIHYFDKPSIEADQYFEEVFGPNSILYDERLQLRVLKKEDERYIPYHYRNEANSIRDISHEFFQMYRYSQSQDRWLLSILDLFRPPKKQINKSNLYITNMLRILSQINTFGSQSNLFTYKFISYLTRDVETILLHSNPKQLTKPQIQELVSQWILYISKVIAVDNNKQMKAVIENHLKTLMTQSYNPYFKGTDFIKEFYHCGLSSHSDQKEEFKWLVVMMIKEYSVDREFDNGRILSLVEDVKVFGTEGQIVKDEIYSFIRKSLCYSLDDL